MKKSFLIKTILYSGAILLLLLISRSFNSLNVLSSNNTNTMREAHDRFKVDDLELQIKESINNIPKNKALRGNKIKEIDEYLIRYEQQLKGRKFQAFDTLKKDWDQKKTLAYFDPNELINGMGRLHKEVNKNILADIAKREAINEKDISHLKILKIACALLIIILVFIAMQLDTIQSKEREELLKRL